MSYNVSARRLGEIRVRPRGNEEIMGVLSNLEPKSVFGFFEEITRIPRGSGNVGRISDYLADFARERGLYYIQDPLKNVIMVKEASPGYEKEPAVILQGHMDMVAVKEPGCGIDMRTEGLKVGIDGDDIYAEGTSLGGDDGIALAYALAILDSDSIKHPRLEAVFTVDEETGMDGARGIDLSMLQGRRMLNLDAEEEGVFLTSCAGGARVRCRIPMKREVFDGAAYEVILGGLLGGHSGDEIHKGRGSSNCLFGRLLLKLTERMRVGLVSVEGGLADNAIPRETKAVLVVDSRDSAAFHDIIDAEAADISGELASKDPNFYIHVREADRGSISCAAPEDTGRAAAFLASVPDGVQAMSADIAGLVETSLNMGILRYETEQILAEFSVRSSIESAKRALTGKLAALAGLAGGSHEVTGDYPGWKYRVHSPLRDKMAALYERMYGQKPKVEAIHAGLECGLLGSKIDDLDCVSLGPQMRDIHTTEETLSISSTARVWEFLVRFLEEMA